MGEILEVTDVNEWRWIPSKENVADEATKWSKSMNFEKSNRWFSGPAFLRLSEDNWPKKKNIKVNVEEEMKAHCVHSALVLKKFVDVERFSKWNRMVRAVAYTIRFRNLFTDRTCKAKPLSQKEITEAENVIFRQAQFEGYPSEMVILEPNKSTPLKDHKFIEKPSPLYDGSPYLDADGILRMRGRIDGARDLSLDTKRPIVLPKDGRITKLLVQHYHAKYYHQNHQTVINEIRQRFYIPRLRVVVNKVRNDCQMCKVKLVKTMEPQMADLPQARLATFAKPFSYVGVDYFGPMKVMIGRRTEKRWGVLFTCLTIRAIHIELVSSLNTNSCIMAIGNFIADRGEVIEFHSDCGTNFTGSDNELKKEEVDFWISNDELKRELAKIDPERLQTEFTSRYTNWFFNPPSAPHMGGSWERLIRSVKSGIYYILPSRTPKEEILRNALKEIQNVVNSRPLTFIPLEVEEDEALTPNHFLHGSSNGMKPPCQLDVDGEYLRSAWKEAQRMTEMFWRRFLREYLPTIARRTKWFKTIKPLEPNDLVLVVDERNPRNTYPRAKVLETIVGSNGQVRKAKIQLIAEARVGSSGKICKVRKTELWRPVHKLAVLDVLSKRESLAEPELERETGGRMLESSVNTGIRRSARIANRSGNTDKCQNDSRKKN